MMDGRAALIHAMQALDWENVPEDAEAIRTLRALDSYLVASGEDLDLTDYVDDMALADQYPAARDPRAVNLPHDADGEMITDASFGELTLVEIIYNTDPDGEWVPFEDHTNRTYHGPFTDLAEAVAWMENHRPDDTDIKEMQTIVVNAVRPTTTTEKDQT